MRDIDVFNQMISKNPEKRFAKNYDFVFGSSYLNDKDFKTAVDNFINSNESVYNAIYDKVVNEVDLGTSEQSARTFANMTEFIRQKENISIEELGNRITKNLTPMDVATNKEIYEHLGLNSSIWNKTIPKTREEAIRNSTEKIKKLQQKLKRTGPQDPKLEKLKTSKERLDYLKQKNEEVYRNSRQTFAKMTNGEHQKNTIKNVQQSHIDDIKNELNNMDSKISELASKDPNHPDLINLKAQREALADNLKRSEDALNNWVSYSNKPKLNPPREGAPMYEGLAVPSVIADTENFNNNIVRNKPETIKINNINNFKPEISNNQIDLDFINDQWMKQKQLEFSNREQQIKDEFSDLNQYDPNKIRDPNYNSSIGAELLKNDIIDPIEWDTNDLNISSSAIESQEIIDMAHEEALKMNATFGDTVKETIENTTENVLEETAEAVGETIAKEVIEEGTEKILKEVTGINVELDGLNKKKTPKKLKKGTGKYKAKTSTINNEIYDRLANSRYWAVDFPESNGDFAVHGPSGTKRLEKEKIDQQRRKRKYEQTRQNQSKDTSTLKNTNNTSEPINADEPVNPINPNDGNENSANMNGSSGGDGSGGNGGDGGNTANPSDDGGGGKKRRKGNSSQADLPKINKLDVDLPEVTREGGSISKYLKEFGNMGFFDKVQTIGAAAGAVSEYKNARRQGHGVVSSTIRAGVDFALGEAMGMYYPLFLLAKEAPGMIVKGSEMLYKENRKMNSSANQQIFGSAQFQDTQQLATMRQSGMEMAKMAQYNLQQTLMGNEATYFHR
jgi:hypothetical protein